MQQRLSFLQKREIDQIFPLRYFDSHTWRELLLVSLICMSTFHSQNLIKLDLSHNGLSSTKLGTEVQLENLRELFLSKNKILALRSEELNFLGNSSLQKLDLSSNPLKEVRSEGKILPVLFLCMYNRPLCCIDGNLGFLVKQNDTLCQVFKTFFNTSWGPLPPSSKKS